MFVITAALALFLVPSGRIKSLTLYIILASSFELSSINSLLVKLNAGQTKINFLLNFDI